MIEGKHTILRDRSEEAQTYGAAPGIRLASLQSFGRAESSDTRSDWIRITLSMPTAESYNIHSEARAGHWVAWVTSEPDAGPSGQVILVGQTQEEAVGNARDWADRLAADPTLRRD